MSTLARIRPFPPGALFAATFWSAALGLTKEILPSPEGDTYVRLVDRHSELAIEVQSVDHPSRVHLDIETDNMDAEIARLEALGARRVKQLERWWVMEAPTGQRFCVLHAKSPSFAHTASEWP